MGRRDVFAAFGAGRFVNGRQSTGERPAKLQLGINLETTRALGVEIAEARLARAEEVIE
jgi:ABC-type uncharacterized transport system substrate-binding protein